MTRSLSLPHGLLYLPEFLPDATRGVVRSVDSQDLLSCGLQGLVMNTFHLVQHPGSSTVQALGGLHEMSGWPRSIITDSGGFQIYSLIRQNPRFGSLNEKGATFRLEGGDRKFILTPEKSIQLQLSYGTDVAICLDDCTHVDAPYAEQVASVERTVDWARRSKAEFERLVRQKQKQRPQEPRPLLFAVIQGGGYPDLRRQCAEQLLSIGFDGYGYGGWPLDSENRLLAEILAFTRSLIPAGVPMHALGIAHPQNVLECYRLGYDLFDGALPTRDARHGRLLTFDHDPFSLRPQDMSAGWFSFLYIRDVKHLKSRQPVSPFCDCLACSQYSLGYLHHLFAINDSLAFRLATIHNLRFMAQLSAILRNERHA